MSKEIIVVAVIAALAIAAVLLVGPWFKQTPVADENVDVVETEPLGSVTTPKITSIDFPEQIEANGQKYGGSVHFENANADIVQAKFEVVEAKLFDSFGFNPKLEDQSEGSFPFTLFTVFPQQITFKVTLVNAKGLESEPFEFSFEAVLPKIQ